MKSTEVKFTTTCSNFIQLSMFIVCTLICTTVSAIEKNNLYRKPSSTPDDEVMLTPTFDKPLLVTLFTDDDAGVMANMRSSLSSWEEKEDFAKTWNLESTMVYKTPSTSDKRKFISNKLLKYADKRLSGEIRKADEGSTLHTVGRVEQSLRPNATVAVSKLISLKFRVRVLQGKAIMEVRNPWLEVNTVLNGHGHLTLQTKKNFNDTGFSSGLEFTANNAEWVAFADQKVSENVKARLSSTQKNQSILRDVAEKKIEMTASFPFNL